MLSIPGIAGEADGGCVGCARAIGVAPTGGDLQCIAM